MYENQNAFELWRQDDNGNRFMIGTFACRAAAESRLAELTRAQHKQTYWITESNINKLQETQLQVNDDNHCFICGDHNPIGLHAVFTTDPEKGRAETRVRIPEHFQGWQGIVHGGILSALLDEICAQACMARGLQVVTSEMRLRYRKPVPTGTEITVIGEIVRDRRRLIDVRGIIELEGETVTEAEVIMFRTAG